MTIVRIANVFNPRSKLYFTQPLIYDSLVLKCIYIVVIYHHTDLTAVSWG